MSDRPAPSANPYDEEYYAHYAAVGYERELPVWRKYFQGLAQAIVDRFHPRTTLDVGCAKAFLAERLRDRGVEAFGVDYSPFAISQVRDDMRPFCRVGSAADPLGARYDLITWIEVAEHMPEALARPAVANLCAHTDQIFFSSTPGSAADFGDPTHVNVQPPSYWEALFAEHGFHPNLNLERSEFFTPQAVHFRRVAAPMLRVTVLSCDARESARRHFAAHDALAELERRGRLRVEWIALGASPAPATIDADLLVLHGDAVAGGACSAAIESARDRDVPVVLWIDDLPTQRPASHPRRAGAHDLATALPFALREADFVIASSARLADELERLEPQSRGRIHVLPASAETCARDGASPSAKAPTEPVVFAWISPGGAPEEIAFLETPIGYLRKKLGDRVAFRFYGDVPAAIARQDGVTVHASPSPAELASPSARRALGADVALAPLADHAYRHAGSDLEWLRWSAAGVPVLASRVAPFAASIHDGETGFLLDGSLETWVRSMERVATDAELRRRVGGQAHDHAARERGLDRGAPRLDALLRSFAASGPTRATTRGDSSERARARAYAAPFFERGRRCLRAGDVDAAPESLEVAVEICPELAPAVLSMAESLSAQGWWTAAERLMAAAAHASSSPAPALYSLAHHHLTTGDPMRAERTLRAGLASLPDDHGLNLTLARLLLDTGREHAGEARLRATLAGAPTAQAMCEAAQEWLRRGRRDEALAALDATLARFPDEPDVIAQRKHLAESATAASPAEPVTACDDGALRVAVYTDEPIASPNAASRLAGPLATLERSGRATAAWSDGTSNAEILERSDVVVLHGGATARSIAEPLVARARSLGKPIVLDLDRPLGGSDAAWLAREARAITVAHESLKLDCMRRFGIPEARVHVLPDTLDPAEWSAAPPSRDARALTVGVVCERGDDATTRAVLEPILSLFDTDPGRPSVVAFGAVPKDLATHRSLSRVGGERPLARELARALQRAPIDVALAPFGDGPAARRAAQMRWLWHAARRTPCVLPVRAASAEHLRHGETAWLVDGSPTSFLEAIAALAADAPLRRRIGEAAWTAAWGAFSTPQHAERWLDLYRSLADEAAGDASNDILVVETCGTAATLP